MLIVFLGNPGSEYSKTRHNAGFILSENLEDMKSISWNKKFKGDWAKYDIDEDIHFLLKPMTFMNKSGESVQAAVSFFKIKPEDIIVVHDDIESDFGVVSVKKGGGLAGHNGLKSIVKSIGSQDFLRLKIGVGRPNHGDVSSHVLGKFTEDENIVLPLILDKALEALYMILEKGEKTACSKFNKLRVV